VAFVAGDGGKGRSREALAVLLAGRDAQGYITGLPADRGYGWIRVTDLAGNVHPIYLPLDEMTAPVERGMVVDFRVEIGTRGAFAADVQPVEGAA